MFIFEGIFAKLEKKSMTNCIAYMIINYLVFKKIYLEKYVCLRNLEAKFLVRD
jgi:hypothetical protein